MVNFAFAARAEELWFKQNLFRAMRFRAYFLAIIISLFIMFSRAFAQTSPQIQNTGIKPFEAVVISGDYSLMAHRTVIIVTGADLKVFDRSGLMPEKDSLLFSKLLSPSDTLFQISKVNFDQLKYSYLNPCVANGSQISVCISKNEKNKRVYLGNYYQRDVGKFLSLVNMLVPEKYRVWYDKDNLETENCTGYERGEAIQLFDSASGNFLRLDSTHTSVRAIDKNGQVLWKTELDNNLWNDILPFRGKNDSVIAKANTINENRRPEITYFRLSRQSENSWCRYPNGSTTLGIGIECKTFVYLDVKNGKLLCFGRD